MTTHEGSYIYMWWPQANATVHMVNVLFVSIFAVFL